MGGGKWEGLIFGTGIGEPDIVTLLILKMSGLGGWYNEFSLPADYVEAIKNAVAAPDFKTKQKLAWEVQKLMVDKYCLQITLWCNMGNAVLRPYVKDSGWFEFITNGLWTPEDAWLER